MGFFSRLFGGKEEAPQPQSQQPAAPMGKAIGYDPELVAKLKEDHKELFALYTKLQNTYAAGKFGDIPKLLNDFKLALQSHLMVENVRFYTYVQQHLAGDEENSAFIADVKHEMDGIARAVVKFITIYGHAPVTPSNQQAFKTELDGIGQVLTSRVQMEESRLYTLYIPY